MNAPKKLDPALQSMLNELAKEDAIAATTPTDARQRKITALYDSFDRLRRTNPTNFKPGDLVQWQPGLKYTTIPAYGEAVVVVEVLEQPVHDESAPWGSTYFRSPGTLVLGLQRHGQFLCWHFDGRRFELVV